MLKIAPIKLLDGSHDDTGKTGQGCFMNVIAYLNGEPQITDNSPCVCVTVKPIAIWLNDYMTDTERSQLLPYIERAMGSATDDLTELTRRAWACAHYAKRRAESVTSDAWAARVARAAAWRAANAASDAWAARAATLAADAANNAWAASAAWAASFDYIAFRCDLIADTLRLLDELLPPATELQQVHIERAQKLIELAK